MILSGPAVDAGYHWRAWEGINETVVRVARATEGVSSI